MREFFTIAIFKIKADIRMNKTTLNSQKEKHSIANFYPRSPCGERPHVGRRKLKKIQISIHALLAESDLAVFFLDLVALAISIHALLAESDDGGSVAVKVTGKFLSTLSLRRATIMRQCAELKLIISIHALLAESDGSWPRAITLSCS